ncbi:hypothetical protein N7450_001501 [Penicillium hetheringtonii]|uniref:Aminotransferase class I/classII large domain-containing protein n=1 Tax=Penicillium hetheringtonii TaxID=911720 RepID=A0AAD6H1H5_9EURO|nr:hypothetical protein N7450_001501 [Penicillium hetheringtonii]
MSQNQPLEYGQDSSHVWFQFAPSRSLKTRYISRLTGPLPKTDAEKGPHLHIVAGYISCLLLVIIGHIRDFFGPYFRGGYDHLRQFDGYAPIYTFSDSFYTRRLLVRGVDCGVRPTTGVPGRNIILLDRASDDHNKTFYLTGTRTDALNLSSYNYLGFAQSQGPCADAVENTIQENGLSSNVSATSAACISQNELEDILADFIGKEASIIFSMGFSTNTSILPSLVSKGSLIISDELNHASIRVGCRLSGASIVSFRHNDMKSLEERLRTAISQGQLPSHRPWSKILVIVEGLYSMEGTICDLPSLVALRRRYKFNLFVDEAHSIGALGSQGKGVCDYFGIDSSEVDILMGTLTKSFGANGGYIAATRSMIQKLRATNPAIAYGEPASPAIITQISISLQIIQGKMMLGQGQERLQRLAFNSRYLRLGLKRLGFIVYGHDDSPVIPLLVINPAKLTMLSRLMLDRKIAVVVAAVPVVPLALCRVRLCASAAHCLEDLERTLMAFDEIGTLLDIKISTKAATGALIPPQLRTRKIKHSPPRWNVNDVMKYGVADAKQPFT